MPFGRKGANWGAGILIIAFITMMIIAIVAAAFQGGGFGVGDPTYVVKFYEKLFSEENLKNPFALVFTVFVPFVSTFAITWAFIGVLPIFQGGYGHKTGERSAAVLAFGISLYTLPMMNMFLLSFFPWSIAIAVIMLFIGLIGRSLHWGIIPHIEFAGAAAEAGRNVQSAWGSGGGGGGGSPITTSSGVYPITGAPRATGGTIQIDENLENELDAIVPP